MWAQGKSYTAMSTELGARSRNVIASKVHRLGLARRPSQRPVRNEPGWTHEHLDHLAVAWGSDTADDIASALGKTPWQVCYRASVLGLKADDGTLQPAIPTFQAQDKAFCAAMMKAIKAGTERAPIGVDQRPCTKNPIFVRVRGHVAPITVSVLADC
jgi:hypothetical protein